MHHIAEGEITTHGNYPETTEHSKVNVTHLEVTQHNATTEVTSQQIVETITTDSLTTSKTTANIL